jgi:hypothetical protein
MFWFMLKILTLLIMVPLKFVKTLVRFGIFLVVPILAMKAVKLMLRR